MRSSSPAAVALLLCCLAPASTWAQQLQCYPCSHFFGSVQTGTSSSYSIPLGNAGKATLRITAKSIQGSGYSLGSFPLPVALQPGASIQLPIVFTPTAQGYASAIVLLTSNDPHSPLELTFTGMGLPAPQLSVTSSLTFGNVNVGASASLQATLTTSNAAITISSDQSTSSEFAILGLSLPVTIPAGQSLPVTIQFTPNASGTASAKAGFFSNAASSPAVAQLTGTGVAHASHSVYLSWNPGDANVVGYNVYRSTASAGPFQEINTALDSSTNYTDYSVVSGATYYYVTTEVNAAGQESGYSNEVPAVIPTP